ncbi:MAG: DEAD/DEAH box helicase [Candidatus Nanoarchaeia archaeon]|jgi:helicase
MDINDLVKQYPCLEPLVKRLPHEFYPPQAEAFNTGFLDGTNLLLASPTSSGKTLVAQVAAMINKSRGGKTIYLVPLRSLAREKYDDFKEFFNGLLSVGFSIGDLSRGDDSLRNNDLIVCSYEKFDSLLRHRVSWIKDVSLVVADEVHLIDDSHRGPTLEVLLTRLKQLSIWVVALSATIGNHESFGNWLNAVTVWSQFRPVKLIEGALNNTNVSFKNDERSYDASSITDLCARVINAGKQSLVFVNTRRSAESVAEKLGLELKNKSLVTDQSVLDELSRKVLKALPIPTTQCKRLAKCVSNGVAFNHAGLVDSQKRLIESAFRNGLIKVISCTTVLAYGVSLPAYMVILRDLKRFESEGMAYIPVSEYLQIAGRAGRSGFDSEGESVVITGGDAEFELAWNNYLCAKPGEIVSKLGVEPVLRIHALALVCDGNCQSIDSLTNFFKSSFFGFEYGSEPFLRERISIVVDELIDWGFIKMINNKLLPSRTGLRVNELYIDPFSARRIILGLNNLLLNPLGFLHLASSCGEVRPLSVSKSNYLGLLESLALNENKLMINTPNPFSYEYEGFVRALRTSLMFDSWINEVGEDKLMTDYGVPPGVLHQLISGVEWVLYAIGEIAELEGIEGVKPYVNGLITRVRYGVKSELLTLVSLKGVGRARARKLYINGLRSVSDLRAAGFERLSKLLGSGIALKLKKQLD